MIRVDGLRFSYPGVQEETLHGLSFSVGKGEIFGFLGPSGSGKSTTQKVLTGLLTGYRGRVEVGGRPLASWGREYYEQVGVSFELPNVYAKLTARENLEFFRTLYRVPTTDPMVLLERVGLSDAAGERVGRFAKGMKMRLGFCRALLHDPELLFLDEPTSGLDPENARLVKEIVRERSASGTTVFLTTHDMAVAADLCDRVAFLVDGRIAEVGAPRDLMVRYGRRRVRVEIRDPSGIVGREFDLDGLGEDPTFLALLREAPVESIHSLDATLEEVFVAVTGRRLA